MDPQGSQCKYQSSQDLYGEGNHWQVAIHFGGEQF